jgi:formylglycine-generating enzyme required for sulfatase activity
MSGGLTQAVDLEDWTIDMAATGFRLPTEAEWEKAARGGLSGKRFPWGNEIDHSRANYGAWGSQFAYDISPYSIFTYHPDWVQEEQPFTSPVGTFPANGYGLSDMTGNAFEWCTDWFSSTRYSSSALIDPTGPPTGTERISRGGAYHAVALYCRIAFRFRDHPSEPIYTASGFRVVKRDSP